MVNITMKQIYNRVVLFNFNSGVVPQQTLLNINVPFQVGKVVVHPLTRYVALANYKTDNYVLQSSAINPEGVGIIGTFAGDATNNPSTQEMKFIYKNPITFNGQYEFNIRCLSEAGFGAANPITARVLCIIEFHEA
jgi:hypothetical protein